jgi:hypothetical protein
MNKTLLLILCDFLLLNLIHFTAWDEIETKKNENSGVGGSQSTGAGLGDPHRDLELVRLQFNQAAVELDEHKRAFINLRNTTDEGEQASAKKIDDAEKKALGWYRKAQKEEAEKEAAQKANRIALEQLKERTQLATLSEEEKKKLEAERKKLEAEAAKLKGDINNLEINLTRQEKDAAGAQKRAEMALADARKRAEMALAAAKKDAADANSRADNGIAAANTRADKGIADSSSRAVNGITAANTRADKGITAANTRTDTERKRADAATTRAVDATTRAQNAEVAKVKATEIANAAQQKANEATSRAQNAEQKAETVNVELTKTKVNLKAAQVAEEVALGAVKDMGGNVAEIKRSAQAIIDNTPISANTLFRQFRSRSVKVWLKSGRTTKTTDTILIQQGNFVYGLMHTSDTPFAIHPKTTGVSRVEATLSTPETGKAKPVAYYLPYAQFQTGEPRVLASPLMNIAEATSRGIRPYQIAAQPYQFPKAFVISRDGQSYGEVEFKLNRAHKGYVKIDTRFAATSFIPSKGDIVLSQKGELLGMMANNTYCYVIRDLKSESSIVFRKDLSRAAIATTLKTHHATIQRKAFDLR